MIMREFPITEKATFNVWCLAEDMLSFHISQDIFYKI